MVIGIESKFTEHLSQSSRNKRDCAPAYFPSSHRLWAGAGLPKCQDLAESLNAQDITYHLLDACQLLKHTLGLAIELEDKFSLYYLYYDSLGGTSERHKEELQGFANNVGEETRFRALTYQQIYSRLLKARIDYAKDLDHLDYVEYLGPGAYL